MSKTTIVTVRVPDDLIAQMPKASLKGTRSRWIIEAIREKVARKPPKTGVRFDITPADLGLE